MPSFEESLARMKALYTYGQELNESNNAKTHTLEYKAVAADGKTYGIIRECNKYYIKSAPKGKETIAEAYDYLGGFCNKKDYEYTSYSNALKNFELKLASINEAHDAKVNISTLDPFRKEEIIAEGTEAMKNEIARQRQIMYNASMLMSEATEIGADRRENTVMYDGRNPEAETGKKGDEELKDVEAKPEFAGSKTAGVEKKAAPFDQETPNCADQLKEGCECGCGEEECKCKGEGTNCEWGSVGLDKGEDPAKIGWDMEGKVTSVNEEDTDDDAPEIIDSEAGEVESEEHPEDEDSEDFDFSVEDLDTDEDETEDGGIDTGLDDVEADDALAADEAAAKADEDDAKNEGILSRIAELQAQIDALKAQVETPKNDLDSELDSDEDDTTEDAVEDDDTNDIENTDDTAEDVSNDDNPEADEIVDDADEFDSDLDECGDLYEAKRSRMDAIIKEAVANVFGKINEDQLHDFGKHPGYRKKPMELPATGEDKNQWGEDINDESVHSEAPFGEKIGDGKPFSKELVDAVVNRVMEKIGTVK